MSYEANTGLGVSNQYGPQELQGVGNAKVEGAKEQLVVQLTKQMIDDDIGLDNVKLPAGALILNAYYEGEDAFTMTGTSPTILLGTDGSEVTNGLVISEAIAEATGAADVTATLTGTWDAKLAAETTLGLAIGGSDTPLITVDGKAKIIVEYLRG